MKEQRELVQIPLVDLKAQYRAIRPGVNEAIQRVLESANFILGSEVSRFEKSFADYVGTDEAVGVASGTAALQLALLACGIGPGDEVITTSHTFIATAEAISNTGAKPIFVDIDPGSFNLDPNLVEAALTPRTRAIVPVHLYGQPAEMESLLAIARQHNLRLIEDAAQAHGAEHKQKRCGSIGDLACFSFYPGKNLGAYGDAGAVTGSDSVLIARVRKLRDHGRTSKYEHEEIGFGERIDALQAAVLDAKLAHLEEWTERRRSHAARYKELLADVDVQTPSTAPGVRHVYHLYVIRTPHRDELLAFLKERGIGAGVHYPIPVHKQPAYLKLGYSDVVLRQTERAAAEVLSLPMYPELTDEQIEYIVEQIREFVPQGKSLMASQ